MINFIDKDKMLANMRKEIDDFEINDFDSLAASMIGEHFYKYLQKVPTVNVSEHIKNRLYETALNEPDPVASDTIADMAERIDFWINELKEESDEHTD